MPDDKTTIIINISKELKKKFYTLCIENDSNMTADIVQMIEWYVEEGKKD